MTRAWMIVLVLAACSKKSDDAPKVATGDPDEGGQIAKSENMAQLPERTKEEQNYRQDAQEPRAPGEAKGEEPVRAKDPYAVGATRLPGRRAVIPHLAFGTQKVTGALPPEVARRILRQNTAPLQYCYEKTLRNNPALKGEAIVHFTIAATGPVVAADIKKSLDPEVDACLVGRIRNLEFPKPEHGVVEVEVPLTFSVSD